MNDTKLNLSCKFCGEDNYFKIITADVQVGRNVFFLKKAYCNRCNSYVHSELCDKINSQIINKEELSIG